MAARKSKFRVDLDIPPSVNHCYVRRRKVYYSGGKRRVRLMNVLSNQAQEWMERNKDRCVNAMGKWKPRDDRKVVVELRVYWPDKRRRDMHNLHKLLADCLEGCVSVDDRWMLMRDMDFDTDKDNPRVEVVAYDKEADG